MSFQQASNHFCNQNTFKSSGLINFYNMVEFDQNILLEWNAKHLLISKQQRDKNKTCFIEGLDVIPKQKCKIP